MYRVALLVVSDRAASGERADGCLPVFRRLLNQSKYRIDSEQIVPDEADVIADTLRRLVHGQFNLILTAGGTGCGLRDVTPEVTRALLNKPTPGLDEAVREFSRNRNQNAVFSRALSGVAGKSFVINLPGSPKAVEEILDFLLPLIEHPLALLSGQVTDCTVE